MSQPANDLDRSFQSLSSDDSSPIPVRFGDDQLRPDSAVELRGTDTPDVFEAKFYEPSRGFDFDDLTPAECPVRLPKDDRKYILKEASTDAARKYRNCSARSAKLIDAKVVGVDGIADAEPLLVALCLFEVNEKVLVNGSPQLRPVPLGTIAALPSRITDPLAQWVKFHSNLTAEGDTEEELMKAKQDIDKRLKALRDEKAAAKGEDDPLKNGQASGTSNSA